MLYNTSKSEIGLDFESIQGVKTNEKKLKIPKREISECKILVSKSTLINFSNFNHGFRIWRTVQWIDTKQKCDWCHDSHRWRQNCANNFWHINLVKLFWICLQIDQNDSRITTGILLKLFMCLGTIVISFFLYLGYGFKQWCQILSVNDEKIRNYDVTGQPICFTCLPPSPRWKINLHFNTKMI